MAKTQRKPAERNETANKPAARPTALVRTENFDRQLRCKLDDVELRDRGIEQAELLRDLDKKQKEAKLTAKLLKNEAEEIEAKIERITTEINDRATMRIVRCKRLFDLPSKTVIETRNDTGEQINVRPMSHAETQSEMDFGEQAKADSKAAKAKPSGKAKPAPPPETPAEQ